MVLNLSTGGAFVRLDEGLKPDTTLFPTKLGEEVKIEIQVLPAATQWFPKGLFESSATMVWTAKQDTAYRYSVGVRFVEQGGSLKKSLLRYLDLVKKRGFKEETHR